MERKRQEAKSTTERNNDSLKLFAKGTGDVPKRQTKYSILTFNDKAMHYTLLRLKLILQRFG